MNATELLAKTALGDVTVERVDYPHTTVKTEYGPIHVRLMGDTGFVGTRDRDVADDAAAFLLINGVKYRLSAYLKRAENGEWERDRAAHVYFRRAYGYPDDPTAAASEKCYKVILPKAIDAANADPELTWLGLVADNHNKQVRLNEDINKVLEQLKCQNDELAALKEEGQRLMERGT